MKNVVTGLMFATIFLSACNTSPVHNRLPVTVNTSEEVYQLALISLETAYTEEQADQIIALLVKATNLGSVEAPYLLGEIYSDHPLRKGNYVLAASYYETAASMGHAQAQNRLGDIYFNGLAGEKDLIAAERWFLMAAEQNHPVAHWNLFVLYSGGDIKKSLPESALKYLTQSAQLGFSQAQHVLALTFLLGDNNSHDLSQARIWLTKAADQGNAEAQHVLGKMHYDGEYESINLPIAYKWFLMAHEQGHTDSSVEIANMYRRGDAVEKNLDKAFSLLQKAALTGNHLAQYNLAWMFTTGEHVEQSHQEAYRLFNQAYLGAVNIHDYALAMHSAEMLGKAHEEGVGTTTNRTESLRWFKIASDLRREFSREELEKRIPYKESTDTASAPSAQDLLNQVRSLLTKEHARECLTLLLKHEHRLGHIPQIQGQIGNCFAILNEWENAKPHFDIAIKTNPNLERIQTMVEISSLQIANNRFISGHSSKFEKLTSESYSDTVLSNMAYEKLRRGKLNEAEIIYRHIVNQSPSSDTGYGYLGLTLAQMKKPKKAIPFLIQATKLNPRNADYLANLGFTYERAGDNQKAIEYYKKALEINPNHPNTKINLRRAQKNRE